MATLRRVLLSAVSAFAFFSCSNSPASDTGASLRIVNNTSQAVALRFGDWAARTGGEQSTPQIAVGATLDYKAAPIGVDRNAWFVYATSDGTTTTNHFVRLVNSDATATYVFNFRASGDYRLLLSDSSFEYYDGATTIVGPDTGTGTDPGTGTGNDPGTTIQTVATPTISALTSTSTSAYTGTAYWDALTVTLACSTSGAEIRYTTNGEDPSASSLLYSTSFTISSSLTVKALALMSGMTTSAVASSAYTVYPPQIAGMGKIAAMARATGSIVYAVDNTAAKLYKLDAAAKTVELAAAVEFANPTDLEYSAEDGVLYFCYRYKGLISRYSVAAGTFLSPYTFSAATGSMAALDLELSDASDRIFVLLPGVSSYSTMGRVAILDKATGAVKLAPTADMNDANLMASSPDGKLLFLAGEGMSPSTVVRYSTTGDALVKQASLSAGGNGTSLAIAPDGSSLAFFCGGGNTNTGYLANDFAPTTFNVNGAWNVGAYPSYGTFSPDSSFFYALQTGGSNCIHVFGRSDYQLKRDLAIPMTPDYAVIESAADNANLVAFAQDYNGAKNRFWFFSDIR